MDLGSLLPLSIPERVDAITYSEYPKWLQHSSRSPVIVNDANQEKTFVADGYFAPGCSDPEGYLLSKVTTKLDDAIRTMQARVEQKLSVGLADLSDKVTQLFSNSIERLKKQQMSISETAQCLSSLQEDVSETISTRTTAIAVDAMDAIRQIAKSTNSGG